MDLSQKMWIQNQQSEAESVILDVRTPEEYQAGHILNAKLINIQNPHEFMNKLSELDTSKKYYVYCRSGARSAQACHLLKQQGISDCYNLLGGVIEWKGNLIS
tara:strand:+ start:1300 stop:1608 length:309 start_codon:yes stop_codon:yes gene_type:complete